MKIRQVVVTGMNQVELQQLELDERLGPDEFLAETECTFISAGTEIANYAGREKLVHVKGSWCAYPWRSGYSNVGIVRAVGSNVKRLSPGDRVMTFGSHASFIKGNQLPSPYAIAAPVPAGLEPGLAAASRMADIAVTAVLVAQICPNDWVAVYGLGMVGNLAAQAFQIMGCRVIGIEPNAVRRKLAERCGIARTVGGSVDEANEAVRTSTGGAMAAISVDAVGHSSVVLQALKATASFGQLILLGSPRVPVETNVTEFLSDVHLRWITVRGALEWCLPAEPVVGYPVSLATKKQMVFDWLQRGMLQLEPQISHRMKPEEIKQAYDGLLAQPEKFTGVILDWRERTE